MAKHDRSERATSHNDVKPAPSLSATRNSQNADSM